MSVFCLAKMLGLVASSGVRVIQPGGLTRPPFHSGVPRRGKLCASLGTCPNICGLCRSTACPTCGLPTSPTHRRPRLPVPAPLPPGSLCPGATTCPAA
eukprot:12349445-Heterocapsa_arctica.AAC.1